MIFLHHFSADSISVREVLEPQFLIFCFGRGKSGPICHVISAMPQTVVFFFSFFRLLLVRSTRPSSSTKKWSSVQLPCISLAGPVFPGRRRNLAHESLLLRAFRESFWHTRTDCYYYYSAHLGRL